MEKEKKQTDSSKSPKSVDKTEEKPIEKKEIKSEKSPNSDIIKESKVEEKVEAKPEVAKTENTAAPVEPLPFKTLLIEDVKYKTLLTKKYQNRKEYTPKNPFEIVSRIPGTIKKIHTRKGKKLKKGDPIMDIESMKMLNTISAQFNCVVDEVKVNVGDKVPKNTILIVFKS